MMTSLNTIFKTPMLTILSVSFTTITIRVENNMRGEALNTKIFS